MWIAPLARLASMPLSPYTMTSAASSFASMVITASPRQASATWAAACAPFSVSASGFPGARKSVEPMAARVEPGRVQAAHQSLHHLVAKSDWSDDAVLAAVRDRVLPIIERRGAIRALIVDDTGTPKKGTHSVGVMRQYCG